MERIVFWDCDGSALRIDPSKGTIDGDWAPIKTHDDKPSPLETLDFPLPAQLCQCCGQELLDSGSRWSVWFCLECKERVVSLNQQARTCVIPIGRHSIMNGVFLRGGRAPKAADIEGFAVELQGLVGEVDRLSGWSNEVVRRNCVAAGLAGRASVPLGEYLAVVQAAAVPRQLAFRAMLEWWRGNAPSRPRRSRTSKRDPQ